MEQSLARELGNSSHTTLWQHLVCHRRIGYIGRRTSVSWLKSLSVADLVYLLCNIICKDCTKITGMPSVAAADENVPHVLVDVVHACDDRSKESAPCHHYIHVLERNTP